VQSLRSMAVLVALLAVIVGLLGLLVTGLLRSHAEILRALHELGADLDPDGPARAAPVAAPRLARQDVELGDRPAADLVGTTPRGDALSIAVVGVQHDTLLAFLTSGCSTCSAFWETFARRAPMVPGGARLVVVTRGPEMESPSRLVKFTPQEVPVVMSEDAWRSYDVPGAPYFAFVDGPSGQIVGEGAGMSWNQVVSLVEQALDDAGDDRRHRRRHRPSGADRADQALSAAGITPGHPSLYGLADPATAQSDGADG